MSNKEFRELQLSSSQLVFIFLSIIILGIVIFLLGVSTGKKHAEIAKANELPAETLTQPVTQEKPQPVDEAQTSISQEISSHEQAAEKKPAAQSESKPQTNKFYIQVGAFNDKQSASTFAERFRGRGYPVHIFDPLPTDRKPVFRVRLGGFSTRGEAESAREKLTPGQKNDYFIVQY